jgi:4'-phosphopantetheinyl transferase EntD
MSSPSLASLSAKLTSLFPLGVVATELRSPGDASLLYPEERHACGGFAPKRLKEFAAGRACARRALAEFGIAAISLPVDGDRRPRWPQAMVGSITHTAGFCGAAVAERARFKGLGLDVECIANVARAVWSQICTPEEEASLRSRPRRERSIVAAITFSAKEAFYKCQYGLTRGWLDFHDLSVEVEEEDETRGSFIVRPSSDRSASLADADARGRFRIHGEFVFTGIALETTTPEESRKTTSG